MYHKIALIIATLPVCLTLHAAERMHKAGTWINTYPAQIISSGCCLGCLSVCVGACAELACPTMGSTLPSGGNFQQVVGRGMDLALCPYIHPIAEYAPLAAAASVFVPACAVATAALAKIPRSVRMYVRDNAGPYIFAGLTCGALNGCCEALFRQSQTTLEGNPPIVPVHTMASGDIGNMWSGDCAALCSSFVEQYTPYAPHIAACCALAPLTVWALAEVGTCCAGDEDSEVGTCFTSDDESEDDAKED